MTENIRKRFLKKDLSGKTHEELICLQAIVESDAF